MSHEPEVQVVVSAPLPDDGSVGPGRCVPRDGNVAGGERGRDRTGRPLPWGTTGVTFADEWDYDTIEEALAGGVWLWNRARFFECHEALEHVWHAAEPADTEFWQGVIQVAVAMVHVQRENPVGAVTLGNRALERLAGAPTVHRGIDVGALRETARLIVDAASSGMSAQIAAPRFPSIGEGPVFSDVPGPTARSREPAWRDGADVLARRSARSEPGPTT